MDSAEEDVAGEEGGEGEEGDSVSRYDGNGKRYGDPILIATYEDSMEAPGYIDTAKVEL